MVRTQSEGQQLPAAPQDDYQSQRAHFFDLSIDMLCIASPDGYFKHMNSAWVGTLGHSIETLTSEPFLSFIHPDDIEATQVEVERQMAAGEKVFEFENRYRCADGTYKWLRWNSTPSPDGTLMYAVATDVTEKKRAEAAIAEKTRALEISNQELEDFTHVVSHDLKAPLRVLEAFAGFVAEDYAGKLDDQGKHYLDVIKQSATAMRGLIENLLELSRIGRTQSRLRNVEVRKILADVRETIALGSGDKKIEIRIPDGELHMVCDDVRVRQVLENLISNAVKYNDKPMAVVEITWRRTGDEVLFAVRDNGPGIEPRYHDKVFVIFQRLVLPEDYEGDGVGLAICKKIVEADGGRIWVESDGMGDGSTFCFTVPSRLSADR